MNKAVILVVAALALVAFAAPVFRSGDALVGQIKKLSPADVANVWVVLCAGSNGWSNYRHQADISHAYQVVRKAGVSQDHIITMMYDDIAYSSSNPTKGIIINEPNGPNVYDGVVIDYKGKDVNKDTFIKVLTGNATTVGSKRVLQSDSRSHVMILFDDHGNTDIVAFPTGEYMHSAELVNALTTMYKQDMYAELVVYISACLSGSMFYKATLPPNCYAATSAPVQASAFALDYDTTRGVYLCSGWPRSMVRFMETSTSASDNMQDQFDYSIVGVQNYSQPCQYGDLDLAQQTIVDFFGGAGVRSDAAREMDTASDAVADWDVPYEQARRFHMDTNSLDSLNAFNKESSIRAAIDKMISKTTLAAVGREKVVPCTTCTSECACLKECYDGTAVCRFSCCDERACTQDYKAADKEVATLAAQAEACSKVLTGTIRKYCGNDHSYLAKASADMHRVCRQRNANIIAAVREIKSQCSSMASLF